MADTDDSALRNTRDMIEGRRPMDPKVVAELERVFRMEQGKIYSQAFRITRDPEVSKELLQDTFETAYRKLPEFDGASAMSTWLCGIAKNLARNKRRRCGETLLEDEDPMFQPADNLAVDALRGLASAERIEVLREAAAAVLETELADVVYLRHTERLSYEDIAHDLKLSGAQEVRVLLQKANRKLKKELERRLLELGHGRSFLWTRDREGDR